MYLIRLDGKLGILSQWKDTRCLSSIQNFWHMDSLSGAYWRGIVKFERSHFLPVGNLL